MCMLSSVGLVVVFKAEGFIKFPRIEFEGMAHLSPPTLKKGDRALACNYFPVSLTCVLENIEC